VKQALSRLQSLSSTFPINIRPNPNIPKQIKFWQSWRSETIQPDKIEIESKETKRRPKAAFSHAQKSKPRRAQNRELLFSEPVFS
jgi:hypothetical protein